MASRHSHLRRFLAGALAVYGALAWPGSATADTFTNATAITITDSDGTGPMPATPYPSPIVVSGMTGTITKVTVTLTGVSHAGPQDIDIVLVSPTGQSVLLMSDNGAVNPISGVTLTFDDAAAASLDSEQIVTGTFKPSNLDDGDPAGGDTFPAPGPAGAFGATLAALNGVDANGTWSLFVVDDAIGQAGSIAGGWTLNITTTGGPGAPTGKLLVTGTGPGGGPHVKVFALNPTTGLATEVGGFFAYAPSFTGGVFVAVGDLNGDGNPEIITGAGQSGGPHVKVFAFDRATGLATEVGGFFAYAPSFTGGVRVAVLDVNGDGKPDIITGPGPSGGPHIRVFSFDMATGAATAIGPEFFAYDAGFTGGVTLGAE